jgi:hypothetical protein
MEGKEEKLNFIKRYGVTIDLFHAHFFSSTRQPPRMHARGEEEVEEKRDRSEIIHFPHC